VDRPHAPPAPLLTVADLAELLQVSTKTVHALAARQELPHVRISNSLRFRSEDVAGFLGRQ
jgi:excisionase family DNA binding protein